jgi:hypothetical protein
MTRFSKNILGTAPAAAVAVIMLVLWAYNRWGYVAADQREAVAGALALGWLCMLFLTATLAAIVWAATVPLTLAHQGRLFFGYAFLTDVCGLLLLVFGLGTQWLRLVDIGALYLLLAAWTALCAALTAALRRWGGGISAAVALTLALLLMSAPISAMPLVRAAASWGPLWQPRIVSAVTHLCPLMAMLDALRPTVRIDFGQLPIMYRYSGLGQSIPASPAPWWISTLIYAFLSLPLAAIARSRRPSIFVSRTLDEPAASPPAAAPPEGPPAASPPASRSPARTTS